MDHSKMPMGNAPATKPAPAVKPAAPGPSVKPGPSAPMDHSKMPMGTPPPATPAPVKGAKPNPADAAVDHSKMPMGAAEATSSQAVDPVCGLNVNPATAPQATHLGQVHYFCSEKHRELFQKNPAKYLPKGQ
jgi:YHS domain-containing protein